MGTLNKLQPGSRFDHRRFRMNVIIDTADDSFVENARVGDCAGVYAVVGAPARSPCAIASRSPEPAHARQSTSNTGIRTPMPFGSNSPPAANSNPLPAASCRTTSDTRIWPASA